MNKALFGNIYGTPKRSFFIFIVDVSQDFEGNGKMSESMSELERTRMQIIFHYLDTNKEINSSIAAKLLKVEIKTASRLLLKAEKLDILKSYGKTKNKVYFRE